MNTIEQSLIKEFKARMDRIAKKNKDRFRTTINCDESGYTVEVKETADGHTFTDGSGETLEECLTDASQFIPDALEQWGYKDAK